MAELLTLSSKLESCAFANLHREHTPPEIQQHMDLDVNLSGLFKLNFTPTHFVSSPALLCCDRLELLQRILVIGC